MNIIITGASGFIGSNLVEELKHSNEILFVSNKKINKKFLSLNIDELLDKDNFSKVKSFNPTHLIHTAAIAHRRLNISKLFLEKAKYINQILPLELYLLANKLGIKRFIFISSIGVHGYKSKEFEVFNENSKYNVYDDYSSFKMNAEKQLIKYSKINETELVILRPALVYGKNAPGNLKLLTKLVDKIKFFPISKTKNSRSFIYIHNLVSAITRSLEYPIISPKTFVIADKETISTEELILLIGKSRNKPILILKIPLLLFFLLKKIPFFSRRISQLIDNLVVDSSKFCNAMDWNQPYSQIQSLKKSFQDST